MPKLLNDMITFLFTDIEGSTRLWEQQTDAMHRDLARHDALLRGAIEANDGRVFKTMGDAFYAAFARPHDAVQAALEAQRALRRELSHVRVRMAVHTGQAEERDGDYFGPALNHVARLLAAGHGGQVLLSRPTAEGVQPALPGDTGLRLLGHHRLRDIAAAETIFQLEPPDLPTKFPPLNTLDVAFRRGVVRTSAIAGVVLLIMLGLTTWAIRNGHAARRNADRANVAKREAQDNFRRADQNAAAATKEARRADGNAASARKEAQRADQNAVEAQREARAAKAARDAAQQQQQIAVHESAEAKRARAVAVQQERTAEERLVKLNVAHGMRLVEEGDLFGALHWFAEAHRLDQGNPARQAIHAVRFAATLQQCPKLVRAWFHQGPVNAARWSPDGRRVVTASDDGTAQIWDVETGERVGRPIRHTAPIRDASFSPDGQRVVTASSDGSARVWEATTGEPVTPPLKHAAAVNQATFSPDARRLVTASDDKTARVWDARTGAPVSSALQHKNSVKSASFSPDGRRVLTASGGPYGGGPGEAQVWDAATGERIVSLPQGILGRSPEGVNYAEFSRDGRLIVTAGGDRSPKVWDAATGKRLTQLTTPNACMNAAFSPDGSRVVTASLDWVARVWDAATGNPVTSPLQHRDDVYEAWFSPDGRRVVTASDDRTVRVWDAATGEAVTPPLMHAAAVRHAAFSPDGRRLLTTCNDHVARVWDLAGSISILPYLAENRGVVRFSPDGRRFLTIGRGFRTQEDTRRALLWDTATGNPTAPPFRHSGTVNRARFSPDGRWVVTASDDQTAQIWDVATGKKLTSPLRHKAPVLHAAFSPDGRYVVTASADHTAQVWDAISHQRVGAALTHRDRVRDAAFSPDGRRVVTASEDRTARIWDTATGRPLTPPLQHPRSVAAASFSPDGRSVLTAADARGASWGPQDKVTSHVWDAATGKPITPPLPGGSPSFSPDGRRIVTANIHDREARVWDARTGRAALPPLKHNGIVNYAAFSPDGRYVATCSYDYTARLWDAATGEPVTPPLKHDFRVEWIAFSSDSRRFATASGGDKVWIGELPQASRSPRDLSDLAQLLTGHRLDASRELAPVAPSVPRAAWQRERPQSPDLFASSSAQVAAWHAQEAEPFENHLQWPNALLHLDRAIAAAPSDADLRRRRAAAYSGLAQWPKAVADYSLAIAASPSDALLHERRANAYGELGQWQKAISDYSKAIELGTTNPPSWSRLAIIQLEMGDIAGYRKAYASLVDLAARSGDTRAADRAAWLYVLLPKTATDSALPLQLAEKAVSASPQTYAVLQSAGGVLYRVGRCDEAIRRLNEADAVQPPGGAASHALLLAMCHFRLGHGREARQWLDKGTRWLEQALRRKPSNTAGPPLPWNERLVTQRLRAEAEALLRDTSAHAE